MTDEITCHIHDNTNKKVGTGTGPDAATALKRAVNSAREGQGTPVTQGSFGCSEKPGKAHEKAEEINTETLGPELPGSDINIKR